MASLFLVGVFPASKGKEEQSIAESCDIIQMKWHQFVQIVSKKVIPLQPINIIPDYPLTGYVGAA